VAPTRTWLSQEVTAEPGDSDDGGMKHRIGWSRENLANLGRLYRLSGEIAAAVFFGEVGQTWRNTVFSANETLGITIGNTEPTLELGPVFSSG